jgi:hypothetical protein
VRIGETCIKIFDGGHMFIFKELEELSENLPNYTLQFIGHKFMYRDEINNAFILYMKSLDKDLGLIDGIWGIYGRINKELHLDSATL